MLGYCPLKSMINCTTYVLTVCLRIVKLFSLHINNAANPPLTKATIKPLPARELNAELIGTTGRGVTHVDDVVFRAGRNRRGEGSSGLSAGGPGGVVAGSAVQGKEPVRRSVWDAEGRTMSLAHLVREPTSSQDTVDT
jgi:hypothetical protein